MCSGDHLTTPSQYERGARLVRILQDDAHLRGVQSSTLCQSAQPLQQACAWMMGLRRFRNIIDVAAASRSTLFEMMTTSQSREKMARTSADPCLCDGMHQQLYSPKLGGTPRLIVRLRSRQSTTMVVFLFVFLLMEFRTPLHHQRGVEPSKRYRMRG